MAFLFRLRLVGTCTCTCTCKGQLELVAVPTRGVVEDRDAHFHHTPWGEMPLRRLHEKRRPEP